MSKFSKMSFSFITGVGGWGGSWTFSSYAVPKSLPKRDRSLVPRPAPLQSCPWGQELHPPNPGFPARSRGAVFQPTPPQPSGLTAGMSPARSPPAKSVGARSSAAPGRRRPGPPRPPGRRARCSSPPSGRAERRSRCGRGPLGAGLRGAGPLGLAQPSPPPPARSLSFSLTRSSHEKQRQGSDWNAQDERTLKDEKSSRIRDLVAQW